MRKLYAYRYGGPDTNQIVSGLCHFCRKNHSLPINKWALVAKSKKVKFLMLVCSDSLNGRDVVYMDGGDPHDLSGQRSDNQNTP